MLVNQWISCRSCLSHDQCQILSNLSILLQILICKLSGFGTILFLFDSVRLSVRGLPIGMYRIHKAVLSRNCAVNAINGIKSSHRMRNLQGEFAWYISIIGFMYFFQKRSKVNIPDLLLEQLHRKLHIESVCRMRSTAEEERPTANPIIPSQFHALFVDDTNRILYCEVPKVACSNWKRVLLMLTGKMNTTRLEDLQSAEVHSTLERKYLKRLDTYSAPEIRFRIDTYYKFMFVRNPLERLLSAYRNKFTASYNTYFPKTFGRKIIKRFRPRPTNDSLAKGHDVTFEEFIKYLLDAKIRQGAPMNAHWRPFHELCMPCTIPYDLIGKYETMDEDVSLALQQMRVNVTFPKAYYSGANRTSSKLVQTYSNITGPELENLFRLYSLDFDMFEYDFPRSMKNPS